MSKFIKRTLQNINTLLILICFMSASFANEPKTKSNIRTYEITHKNSDKVACVFGLNGQITDIEATWLKDELKDPTRCEGNSPNIFWIISSGGGDVKSALEIMELIDKYNLITFIYEELSQSHISSPGKCLSACGLIFSSGKQRHFKSKYDSNNFIGIHKPSFVNRSYDYLKEEKELDTLKYELIKIMEQNGVDPRFVIAMYQTRAEEMYYETLSNLLIWDVVTSLDFPLGFPR